MLNESRKLVSRTSSGYRGGNRGLRTADRRESKQASERRKKNNNNVPITLRIIMPPKILEPCSGNKGIKSYFSAAKPATPANGDAAGPPEREPPTPAAALKRPAEDNAPGDEQKRSKRPARVNVGGASTLTWFNRLATDPQFRPALDNLWKKIEGYTVVPGSGC